MYLKHKGKHFIIPQQIAQNPPIFKQEKKLVSDISLPLLLCIFFSLKFNFFHKIIHSEYKLQLK